MGSTLKLLRLQASVLHVLSLLMMCNDVNKYVLNDMQILKCSKTNYHTDSFQSTSIGS